ncbi:MAG: hypothetical protein MJ188_09340 [Treponema sp.]|nr:hypothetical protein [Treponema sp.]
MKNLTKLSLFSLVLFFSFISFSCASNDTKQLDDLPVIDATESTEQTVPPEKDLTTDTSIQSDSPDLSQNPEDSTASSNNSFNLNTNEKLNLEDLEDFEDFEEPLVRDLPLEDEITTETPEEPKNEPEEEPVLDELLDYPNENIDENPAVIIPVDEDLSEIDTAADSIDSDDFSTDDSETLNNENIENDESENLENRNLDEVKAFEDANIFENQNESQNTLNTAENTENESSTDFTDNFAEEETDNQEPFDEITENSEDSFLPSRSVTMKKGENLEVVYPGTGWVYMGSLSDYNNLASRGRKLGASDTKYTLFAKEAGKQIQHFYKIDNLTGEYIDDYLEVIVLEEKGSSKNTVIAPEYSAIVPKKTVLPATSSDNAIKNNETVQNAYQPENDYSKDSPLNKNISTKENDILSNNIPDNKTSSSVMESAETDFNNFQKTNADNLTDKLTETLSDNLPNNNSTNRYDYTSDYHKNASEYNSSDNFTKNHKDTFADDFSDNFDEDFVYAYSHNDREDDVELLLEDEEEWNISEPAYLDEVKNLIIEREYIEANKLLNDFLDHSNNFRDQAYFLQGQILEAESPLKNIKEAIKSYENVINYFPSSDYWDEAKKRITYLKRFYINVR